MENYDSHHQSFTHRFETNPVYRVDFVLCTPPSFDLIFGDNSGRNWSNFLQKRPIDPKLSVEHLYMFVVTFKPKKGMCTQQAHEKTNFDKKTTKKSWSKLGGNMKSDEKNLFRKLSIFLLLKS